MQDVFAKMVEEVEKKRAEKVARFLELVRDPELSTYVAWLQNGQSFEQKKIDFAPPEGFKSGNGLREAVRTLTLPQRFTSDDVHAALLANKFQFSGKDPKAAVRDAVLKLSKGNKPVFRIIRKGAGGLPNVYERIENG